jgi:ribose transport system substrate-binding protein
MSRVCRIIALLLCVVVLASLPAFTVVGQDMPENPTADQDPGDTDQQVYWVRYNFDEGAYELAADAEGDAMTAWDASMAAEAMGDVTICFTPESEEFDFDLKVNPSMRNAAEAAGVELLVFNNAYPSTTQPLQNADACVTREPDLVVSFNVFAEITEAIMSKYNAENIPVIAVDVTHPGSVFWGADNCMTGRLAAQFAADWAVEHMWPEEEMVVLTGLDPAVGGAPACRNTAFTDFFKENMPAIPDENYFDVDMRTAELGPNAGALAATTDWLTANPNAKYIVATSINDDRAFGIASAMAQADRGDPTVDGVVVGKNADAIALDAIREGNSPLVGTVSFFPERYGDFMIPLALDILAGNPVPSIVRVPHEVISIDNIDTYYPEEE